jgi:endonuclease-3
MPVKKSTGKSRATDAKSVTAVRKVAAPKSAAALAAQAKRISQQLAVEYADAQCALYFKTPFQLLVATILSAQCTDQRVNIVTKDLFKKYPDAAAFASTPISEIERAIQSTGFFRNKAKNIKACATAILQDHGGTVPRDLDSLVALPGIGRKTANVVLGTAFGLPTGIVVDTHVGRLARRLGVTRNTDPEKVEQDLMKLLPREEWIDFSHRLIHHGRQVCMARKPKCETCSMESFCPKIGV